MPLIRCANVFFQGRLSRQITAPPPPARRLVPSLGIGKTIWVRQLRSGSCHYPTAATKCNEQPNQATETTSVEKHAHPPRVVLLWYFEFEICILQALNMPLIRCANVFFQGRLSRHTIIEVIPPLNILTTTRHYYKSEPESEWFTGDTPN